MTKIETKPLDAEELVKSKLQELIDFRKENNDIKEFWGKQFDLGLAWVQFPEGAGGLGLNPKYQLMVIETLRNEGISQQIGLQTFWELEWEHLQSLNTAQKNKYLNI